MYSKNFFTHNAVYYLSRKAGEKNIFCFYDRVRFLTSATLLENALIVIDAIESPPEDVAWLVNKLRERGKTRNTHMLTSSQGLVDFLKHRNLNGCAEKCQALWEWLLSALQSRLCLSYTELIRHEILGDTGREIYLNKYGHKTFLNRRYQINRKFKFDTLHEYNSLLIMLTNKIK